MTEKELNDLAEACDRIDKYLNEEFKAILLSQDKHLAVNAMINIATSTLSKVLLMVQREHRQSVMQTAISVTHDKTREGDERIRAMMASLSFRGGSETCYPDLSTRH